MEANELMIGDWVKYHDHYKRVEYIYCRPLPDGTNPANEVGWGANGYSWVNACNIEPIPLTLRILNANGFVRSDFYSQLLYENWIIQSDCHFLRMKYANGQNVNINCKHVHELQHALRLCGLSELADNFKITKEE